MEKLNFNLMKKGMFFDFISIAIVLFIVILGVLSSRTILDMFYEGYTPTSVEGQNAQSSIENTISLLDWMPVILIVVLLIIGIISVSLIQTHPAFAIVSIILLFVVVMISGELSNIFNDMSSAGGVFENSSADQPISMSIIENLPLVVMIIGTILIGFMYAKGGLS